MQVSDIITRFSVQGRVLGTGPLESQAISINHAVERKFLGEFDTANVIAVKRFRFFDSGKSAGIDGGVGSSFTTDAGTRQEERATVVAGAGVTSSNHAFVVTVTGIYDHDLGETLPDVQVPVSIISGNSATNVAERMVLRLNANPTISKYFVASNAAAVVSLISRLPRPNNISLAMSWGASNGISAVTASTNFAAGVGGVILENAGASWVAPFEILYVGFVVQSGSLAIVNGVGPNGTYPHQFEINPSVDVGGAFTLNSDLRFLSQEEQAVLDVIIIGKDAS